MAPGTCSSTQRILLAGKVASSSSPVRPRTSGSRPAAVSGWPSLTVPAGYVSGLPVGVTFTGPRWSEPRLLALAYAFEQASAARRVPALSRP